MSNPDQRPMYECDAEVHTCPYCQGDVCVYITMDTGAIISYETYVLIADWVYHTKCWDALMLKYPPGEGEVSDGFQDF